jgi:hypothetical protein
MRLSSSLVSAALLFVGATAPAHAQGLFVKLAAENTRVSAAEPVKVRLTTVVTRTFNLPAPEFLIDDGTGLKARPEIKVKAVETGAAATVAPGMPHQASWEVELPAPGRYKIQARYRLDDRVAQSNKLDVEVTGGDAAPAKP